MNKIIPNALVNKMMKDRLIRTSITKDSFLYFFHFYYAHYVKYETADFQKEIMHHLESSATENFYVVAFRGSGKSTMVTTAYPIWAILGKQQKKFCIIFCQTRAQAKQHMMNIRTELEGNDLLKKDLGPFQEESDEWGSHSLVFRKHGARITVASSDQSIRGLRHNEHRPDLIICDDVEDVQSTKTREGSQVM
jgi:superfamily II DNA or RNA helicase